ncbi:hypothetical protein KEM55_008146 [Ascosphaera atra]|nr:hypothetical protein KEM55_008146 [Ascosphaera atra]
MGSLEDQLEELRLTSAAPSSSFDAPFSPFTAFSGFPSPIKSPFQTLTTTTPATHATPSAAFSGLSGGIDIPSIPRRFTADAGKLPWGGAFSGSHQRASIAALPDLSSMFGGLSSMRLYHAYAATHWPVICDAQRVQLMLHAAAAAAVAVMVKSCLASLLLFIFLALQTVGSYEKKLQHMEQMREQRRQLEVDMKMFDLQQEREQQELNQLARDLAQAQAQAQAGQNRLPRSGSVQYPIQPGGHHQRNLSQVTQGQPLDESSASSALSSTSTSAFSSGHVSQPTTPPMQQKESSPEDGSRGFPSSFARPARFSTSSANSNGWFIPFGSPPQQRDLKDLKPLPKIGSAPGSAMASRRNSEDEHFAPGTSLDQRQVPG